MDRMDKINQRMKREIGEIILKELTDPRLEFVTITKVDVTRDLHLARVHFSVLGDSLKAQKAQEGLDSARGYIRKLIGSRVRLRYTPEIQFFHDQSLEFSARIETALQEIHDELDESSANH